MHFNLKGCLIGYDLPPFHKGIHIPVLFLCLFIFTLLGFNYLINKLIINCISSFFKSLTNHKHS